MIDIQGCYVLQGTKKDRECLQTIREKKVIQVYCCHPHRSLFPMLYNSCGLSTHLPPPISISFYPMDYQVNPFRTQFVSCFQKPNTYFAWAFFTFYNRASTELSSLISQTNQTTPLLKHAPCFSSSILFSVP